MNNRNIHHEQEMGMPCAPMMKPPCERVVCREFHHCVEHVQPVHTRIINKHICHHVCRPCFTCSEENVVCNVFDNNCC